MNYKRKPITVQALQWTGDNIDLIKQFMDNSDKTLAVEIDDELKMLSLGGYMTAYKGDYIIRTKHGEVYPCNLRSFKEIYEATS